MASTIEASLLEVAVQLREQAEASDSQNKYNEFRALLKTKMKVDATQASALYKAAGEAIQLKKPAAAMAARYGAQVRLCSRRLTKIR